MRGNLSMKPEFAKPGMNPFFTALAQSRQAQTEATPVQKLGIELRALEKLAEAGDLRSWQVKLPEVVALSESVHADPIKRLEVQVQIKKYELTLYLKASKQALQQAQSAEQQARAAELTDDTAASRELWAKAQKLKRLGEHFQQRLMSHVGGLF
ncbi:MAG: hypothetical protein U1F66_00070 [bacterium]